MLNRGVLHQHDLGAREGSPHPEAQLCLLATEGPAAEAADRGIEAPYFPEH
jgi:hypothetical protein